MTTTEVANRLVEMCRSGQVEEAKTELFADDIVSIEPAATPYAAKETHGLKAIREKAEKFMTLVEDFYSMTVTEPIIAGNSFACVMTTDLKMKGQDRMTGSELCVYKVRDGKIISEEFFM
jgi:ketosteroid isomerase-like protein